MQLGAAQNAALVIVGEELDLYRNMKGRGPISAGQLAGATDTGERYVQEWLSAQAASGFIDYDAATGMFELSPEQAAVFAIDDSPVNMIGGFQALDAVYADRGKLTARVSRYTAAAFPGKSVATACSAARTVSSGRATRPT